MQTSTGHSTVGDTSTSFYSVQYRATVAMERKSFYSVQYRATVATERKSFYSVQYRASTEKESFYSDGTLPRGGGGSVVLVVVYRVSYSKSTPDMFYLPILYT